MCCGCFLRGQRKRLSFSFFFSLSLSLSLSSPPPPSPLTSAHLAHRLGRRRRRASAAASAPCGRAGDDGLVASSCSLPPSPAPFRLRLASTLRPSTVAERISRLLPRRRRHRLRRLLCFRATGRRREQPGHEAAQVAELEHDAALGRHVFHKAVFDGPRRRVLDVVVVADAVARSPPPFRLSRSSISARPSTV